MADYIPRSDAKFNNWAKSLVEGVSENLDAWGIGKEAFEPLELALSEWEKWYAVAAIRQTRTMGDVLMKNESRAAFLDLARPFVRQYLAFNDRISNSERTLIGVTVRSGSHAKNPVPHSSPFLQIDFSQPHRHSIYFKDHNTLRKAKPQGVFACEIWMSMDPTAANDDSVWHFVGMATRPPFIASYDFNQSGKRVYYKACWINTRGKRGSWSTVSEAVIG